MNEHSAKFDLVKKYYDDGRWNITAVQNAVVKNWITVEEFKEITGEDYTPPQNQRAEAKDYENALTRLGVEL